MGLERNFDTTRCSGTLLLTDIVKSVQLRDARAQEQFRRAKARHDQIVTAAVANHPTSRIIKSAGDAWFLFFQTADDAVRAALDIQLSVSTEPWGPIPLQVTMAAYSGDFTFVPNHKGEADLEDKSMDVAARIHQLALPNQLLLNRQAYDDARKELGDTFEPVSRRGTDFSSFPLSWIRHGPYRFKGPRDEYEVCEVGIVNLGPFRAPPDKEKAWRDDWPQSVLERRNAAPKESRRASDSAAASAPQLGPALTASRSPSSLDIARPDRIGMPMVVWLFATASQQDLATDLSLVLTTFTKASIEVYDPLNMDDLRDQLASKPDRSDPDAIVFLGDGPLKPFNLFGNTIKPVEAEEIAILLSLPRRPPVAAIFAGCFGGWADSLLLAAPFVITLDDTAILPQTRGFLHGFLKRYLQYGRNHVQAAFNDAANPGVAKLHRRAATRLEVSGRLVIESRPGRLSRTIWVDIAEVEARLRELGRPLEEVGHLIASRLNVHLWIFGSERLRALIPIGVDMVGEFSWRDAADVIVCNRLWRINDATPPEDFAYWCLLTERHNDLYSMQYRNQDATIPDADLYFKALEQFNFVLETFIEPRVEMLNGRGVGRQVSSMREFCNAAARQLRGATDMQHFARVRQDMETAMMHLHDLVNSLQPTFIQ